jgi:hypothetical protein
MAGALPASPAKLLARRVALSTFLGILTTFFVSAAGAVYTVKLHHAPTSRWAQSIVDPAGKPLPPPVNGTEPPGSSYFELQLHDSRTATYGMSRLRPFQNYTPAAPPTINPSPESIARRWERAVLLPWVTGARPWPDPLKGDRVWVKATGWPFRAFYCQIQATNAPNFGTHTWTAAGGLILDDPTRPGWADWPPDFPCFLPLRPLWPELLADAAIYSMAWALLLFPFATARRAFRLRRGRCPRCTYDLRGLPPNTPCPECGWIGSPQPSTS